MIIDTRKPEQILLRLFIVGIGMFIGGVLFQFVHPFLAPGFAMTAQSILLTGAIILFGTAVAFLAYLESVKYIEASLASVMTALEPLLAAILSVLVFGNASAFVEWPGIAIVLGSVLLLSNFSRFKEKIPSRKYGKEIL
ncbi:DMT family transporter [uncultured Trichococcus sp.]|uniref:DMT family transporter n=1 Tax=uncultured Trichococcus sp. TaxID=189665 RepID=UPI0029C70EB6|nr:DMT family transporter [uncultured Trichococcus sp.]